MTQEERLDYLVKKFTEDSADYKNIAIPDSIEDKKILLRSLMNIRMPRKLPDEVLKIQDEYLTERAKEKGIIYLENIPETKNKISIWQGDITRLATDAIVNAANSEMLGCFVPMHTCIDNCIHTFAGVELRYECNKQMNSLRAKYGKNYEQPTAIPMITDAYNLPAKKIIHIVGPINNSIFANKVDKKLEKKLSDCYKNILDICLENNLRSVAFCCISTGVFRFPNKLAAKIAVNTVENWLEENNNNIDRVVFNVFKDTDRRYYEELL